MKIALLLIPGFVFSSSAFGLVCHGTEPFWGAKVSKTEVIYSDLAVDKEEGFPVQSVEAVSGVTGEYMSVYSNKRGPVAVITTRECNDGMSDETFPKEILLFTDEGTFTGCCEE